MPSKARRTDRDAFLAHPLRAFLAGLALIVLVLVAALVIPQHPLEIDTRWLDWMGSIESGALTRLARVFDHLGRGIVLALTLAAVGGVLLVARRWVGLTAFAIAEAVAPLLSGAIKAMVDRPRPSDAMLTPAASSFPSGHATYAGATPSRLFFSSHEAAGGGSGGGRSRHS